MDRKRFLRQLGGTSLLAILPVATAEAFIKKNPLAKAWAKAKIVRDNEGTKLHVLGNPQWHKVVGADTGEQIFEWIDDVKPGSGIPPHVHTKEDEIFRVLQGEVELMVDGKATVLKAGDMAFAPKNIPHAWKVIGDQNAKMWVSAFPSGMEHMFHELDALPPGPPDLQKVAAICATYGIEFI